MLCEECEKELVKERQEKANEDMRDILHIVTAHADAYARHLVKTGVHATFEESQKESHDWFLRRKMSDRLLQVSREIKRKDLLRERK